MDSSAPSNIKMISWRICGSAVTSGVVYALTGQGVAALVAGTADLAIQLAIRFGLDRAPAADPVVLWFTGLSGSGKSTLATAVAERLRERGMKVDQLDGDAVRGVLPKVGVGREERNEHIRRVGFLASRLEKNGVSVVASFVSPYEESRAFARGLCRKFIEVHVSTPLEECERRDVKGLYKQAREGKIKGFTGIDDPYEEPTKPELRIDTSAVPLSEAVERVLNYVSERQRA